MNLLFWRKKKEQSRSIEQLASNLMSVATDPDKAWEVASSFRKTGVPGSVVTCETSFLLGSVCRNIVRVSLPSDDAQGRAIIAAEQAYEKIFLDESEERLPPEMQAVYGDTPLFKIATQALRVYGSQSDLLPTTVPIFVRRLRGDPRMAHEIKPLIEEREQILRSAFVDAVATLR